MTNNQLDIYIQIILIVINVLLVICFLFYNKLFSTKLRLIDKVDNKNKITLHSENTPNSGGLILLLFLLIYFNYIWLFDLKINTILPYIFIFSFFLFGLMDDYFTIKAFPKIAVFTLIIFLSLRIYPDLMIDNFYSETFNKKFDVQSFSTVFTIICIFFMLNILNMFDGINGSLLSICISFFFIMFLVTINFLYLYILLVLILLLIFNLSNKIFLGNNGSTLLSALISYILIIESKNYYLALSAEKILLIFAIPSFDLLRLFYIRIKNKKNPFSGDLNHFHHLVLQNYKTKIWLTSISSYLIISYFISFYINTILIILVSFILYSVLIKKHLVR